MSRPADYDALRAVEHITALTTDQFCPDDWFLTLGYHPGREHHTRKGALYFFKLDFIAQLRRERKAKGIPFAYLYSLRWTGSGLAPEFAVVLKRGSETEEDLRRLWPYGCVIRRPLREMGELSGLVYRLYMSAQSSAGGRCMPIVHSRHMGATWHDRRFSPTSEIRNRLRI